MIDGSQRGWDCTTRQGAPVLTGGCRNPTGWSLVHAPPELPELPTPAVGTPAHPYEAAYSSHTCGGQPFRNIGVLGPRLGLHFHQEI